MANRSTCQGRWVRIRSNASFIGGGSEDFVDLESLTYDNSLVPAGQLIYKLPEIESSNQQCYQQSSSGVIPTSNPPASLPSTGKNSSFNKLLEVCIERQI